MTEADIGVSPSLRDKRILIVGGTRGIGAAMARRFSREGAELLVNFVREREPAERLCGELQAAGGRIASVRADVTSDKGREELVAAVAERFPTLDGIVFAAATGVHKPVEALTGRHFDFTFALNVRALLLLVQPLLPRLQPGSSIVAVSSEGAVHAMPHYTLVGASKGALESLSRHLAAEFGPRGIRVNVLSPGTVRTEAWDVLPDSERRLAVAAERSPLRRLVSLEEVAAAGQFLLSSAAGGITGHTLVVDAGSRIVGHG